MLIKEKTTINGIEMELQNLMDWSTYDQMWVEIGIDAEGNKYELYYADVEGQELEDYDYDKPVKIEKIEGDQEERTMKTMYEIELVRVDKNGAITFSNSENANFVDQLDEVAETLEEAQARANELQYKFYVRNDYDRIIINEITVDEDGEILDAEHVEEMEVA